MKRSLTALNMNIYNNYRSMLYPVKPALLCRPFLLSLLAID